MPTININKNYLFKLLGKKMPEGVLLERISMMGTAIEGETKDELIVELFPNRPDMLSVEGFARGLSLFLGLKNSLPSYSAKKTALKVEVDKSVKEIRPYIKCAVVKGLNLNNNSIKSIMQLQEKLHQTHGRKRRKVAIGIHDFDHMKFPVTYKAVAPDSYSFIPLGEKKRFTLDQILKKTVKGQQYAWVLSGFKEYPLLVDSDDNVMSFPPIINGELTAVTERTKNIFIDVTGTDELSVSQALNIVATTLADIGGEIFSVTVEKELCPALEPTSLKFDIAYVNKLLGLNLKETGLKHLLFKTGLGYKDKNAIIPCYRVDIIHPMDIAEEIAIAYGYENFEPTLPTIATIGQEDPHDIFYRHVSNILIGLGFLETSTFHLTNYSDIKTKMNYDAPYVELANSVSSESSIIRSWLLPMQVKVLSDNKTREFPHRIFEIGAVVLPDPASETKVSEHTSLAAAISDKTADFTKIKQVLDTIMSALRVKCSLEESDHSSFIAGRAAVIVAEGKKIGFLGELSPLVLANWQIEMPVCCLEIDIEKIFSIINSKN